MDPRQSGAAAHPGAETALQWVFSDGLATVSMFLEIYDRQRHMHESQQALGATQSVTRRWADKEGEWWVTVLGEVPAATLNAFVQSLERKKP